MVIFRMHCEVGSNELVSSLSAPSVLTGDSMNDLNVTASTCFREHAARSSGSVRDWVKVAGHW